MNKLAKPMILKCIRYMHFENFLSKSESESMKVYIFYIKKTKFDIEIDDHGN